MPKEITIEFIDGLLAYQKRKGMETGGGLIVSKKMIASKEVEDYAKRNGIKIIFANVHIPRVTQYYSLC